MSTETKIGMQVIHDKLESEIKIAGGKLETLKARAAAAKANIEIKAIEELLPKKHLIEQKLQDLKKLGGDQWEQVKIGLEARVAEFEKSVKGIESKLK